jgi:hypothetical protein
MVDDDAYCQRGEVGSLSLNRRSGFHSYSHTQCVLIAEEDWRAIQETVYLLSIPGMRESIREGLNTTIEECAKDPGW